MGFVVGGGGANWISSSDLRVYSEGTMGIPMSRRVIRCIGASKV